MAVLPASGTLSKYGDYLHKPIGSVHWAGTETATEFYGYMEGALQSAERVVAEISSVLPAQQHTKKQQQQQQQHSINLHSIVQSKL